MTCAGVWSRILERRDAVRWCSESVCVCYWATVSVVRESAGRGSERCRSRLVDDARDLLQIGDRDAVCGVERV